MELRDLRAFVTLSDVLHFSQAAERLHITQSALSKQIKRLEQALGGALLARSAGATTLTPSDGHCWMKRATSCAAVSNYR